jgi:hypothetical protein
MSFEALLERVAVAIERNTESVEKLCAGRDAALAQFEKVATAGEAPKPRSRKKADAEPAAGNGAAAAAETTETVAAASQPATEPSIADDDLRNAAQAYIGGAGDDVAARQARGANLKAILDHFGVSKLVGPEGLQDPEQKQQALFYLKRYDAGITVDFAQDYDFSGDPLVGGESVHAAAVTADEDEFAIG